jgi:hypothetical protein
MTSDFVPYLSDSRLAITAESALKAEPLVWKTAPFSALAFAH